jgi:hypothetical protein
MRKVSVSAAGAAPAWLADLWLSQTAGAWKPGCLQTLFTFGMRVTSMNSGILLRVALAAPNLTLRPINCTADSRRAMCRSRSPKRVAVCASTSESLLIALGRLA